MDQRKVSKYAYFLFWPHRFHYHGNCCFIPGEVPCHLKASFLFPHKIFIYIYYYITFSYHGNLYYIKLYWWRVTEWLCITHFTWCYRNKHTLHKKTYIKSSFHCHLNYACVEQSSNGSVWLATRLRRSYWTATNEQHSIWLVEAALALLTAQWVCLLLLQYDEMENVK